MTVCLPTTGRLEYIEDVFKSIRQQTYPRLEILILDNASGADASSVLQAFAAGRADTEILRVDERMPMFANFNRGVRAATGKYIVFFHDDDVYLPHFIERHIELLERSPNAAFAGGNYDVIDAQGKLVRRNFLIRRTETWDGRRFIGDLVRRGRGRIPTPAVVFRSSMFKPLAFDEGVNIHWGDFATEMELAEKREVAMLAETHYLMRQHAHNASGVPLSRSFPIRTQVLQAYCREFARRHPEESAFVRELEHNIERTHRWHLVLAWLTASDKAEAVSCLAGLKDSDPRLERFLEFFGRPPLHPKIRSGVISVLRRIDS